MIEESDDEIIQLYKDSDFAKKAKILPVTFVIKARRLQQLKKQFFTFSGMLFLLIVLLYVSYLNLYWQLGEKLFL